ncbi:MAG: hypothetical protein SFV15_21130 [Polyangiaceae bacterium]|nr:hypothetical protein [Polyangiaceae bacterium]
MRFSRLLVLGASVAALPLLAIACSDDAKTPSLNNPTTGGASAAGGKAASSGGAASAAGGAASAAGGATQAGGTAGVGTGGAEQTGGTGTGGAPAVACDLSGVGKTRVDVIADIAADTTFTADKVWVLKDKIRVHNNATLTIEKCTRIEGTKEPLGALIIARSSKIQAVGTAEEPILFTSTAAPGARAAGDWGGVVLLGHGINNQVSNGNSTNVLVEGLADDPLNKHGGADNTDNSGTMKYVRIEFAGYQLAKDVELNGLTFGSVGSGTTIDHIEVSNGLDDCFEWFGGAVNASHLICNGDGDDAFDIDRGYVGTLSYLFGRKFANASGDPTGFEWDNFKDGQANLPRTRPVVSNVTLCGFGVEQVGKVTYGGVFRRGTAASIDSWVASGFDYGFDMRDDAGTTNAPYVTIVNASLFGMRLGDIANAGEGDNDFGFDETVFFGAGAGNNTTSAGFTAAECIQDGAPASTVTSFTTRGAFTNGNWMTGKWVDWSKN